MRQVGYLQRLYRDVRSTEHEIHLSEVEPSCSKHVEEIVKIKIFKLFTIINLIHKFLVHLHKLL